ncbi:mitochondrial carrier protein [Tricharina praecox]|uniref:mitochondrial carrier protein n=1 Tax=Tricharina praecox TaxID=43433 RepID=UPI00221FB498|nr:mitochondrial carrier protein [Tricharina praecox]KAI5857193.1 mitochondrial carrier protein [Tricharina praecox]
MSRSASNSSSGESDTPPPPPPNTPTEPTSGNGHAHSRLPGVPGGNDWRRGIVAKILPHWNASSINPGWTPAIAGGTAGFVSGVFTCPLDVVKTKLQAQAGWSRTTPRPRGAIGAGELKYRGLIGTTKTILREDGLRGMYKGLGPLILGYLPTWTVYFTVYEKGKVELKPYIETESFVQMGAAVLAGASSTLCTNPIWVIKTRLMSQPPAASSTAAVRSSAYFYYNTWDAARKMYRYEGLKSFYSGLSPALLGLTHVSVQFPVYEFLKKHFTGGIELGKQDADGNSNFSGILAASCLSKICASCATYPHEVLRTRLQRQRILSGIAETAGAKREVTFPKYRGIFPTLFTIIREEGGRALYNGMGTNLVRAVPSSAMTILTYEFVAGLLSRLREESINHYGSGGRF